MLLEVPYDHFAQEITRRLGLNEAFAVETLRGVFLTAAEPNKNLIVCSFAQEPLEQVKTRLGTSEIKVSLGEWCTELPHKDHKFDSEFYISVVAYHSSEQKPGIWVDASTSEPQTNEILNNFYSELSVSGEIPDIGLEAFIHKTRPNVLVLHSNSIQSFLEKE